MSIRLITLLCLCGLVACSNNTNQPTARDPAYVDEPTQATTEPTMRPASLEASPPTAPAATPSPDERPTATTAPLVADTKSASPDAFKSNGPERKEPARPDAAPDNTKVNERDANGAALTPLDQGNGATDLKITQLIRQGVMSDGSLSFTAKNVKIITQGGKVTLRGPVKSEQERTSIEATARKVAGVAQVDNQLEVKK